MVFSRLYKVSVSGRRRRRRSPRLFVVGLSSTVKDDAKYEFNLRIFLWDSLKLMDDIEEKLYQLI